MAFTAAVSGAISGTLAGGGAGGGSEVDLMGDAVLVAGWDATDVAAVDDLASECPECVDHLFSDDDKEGECERFLENSSRVASS